MGGITNDEGACRGAEPGLDGVAPNELVVYEVLFWGVLDYLFKGFRKIGFFKIGEGVGF